MTDKKKKRYLLKDVQVDTVGLVTTGATGEQFFLLKSNQQEEHMPEDIQDVQVNVENPEVDEQETEPTLKREEVSIVRQFLNLFKTSAEIADPVEDVADDKTEDVNKAEVELAELRKRQDELEAELAKARQEAEENREAREKQDMIEKASALNALPVEAAELADHVFAIHKADPGQAEWLVGFLKSVDAQLKESNLFDEQGTNETPDQPASILEKAQKMIDDGKAESFKEALLKLDADEQNAFLVQRHAQITGKTN